MATPYPFLSNIAISIIFLCLLTLSHAQVHGPDHHGTVITLNMIHHDAPNSPFYTSTETNWQRISNLLRRSHQRINRLIEPDAQSPITYNGGEYLLNVSIGTPPRPFIAVVDTGSGLSWTQCMPCTTCFTQSVPIFDPASSSTYAAIPCKSDQCHLSGSLYCASTCGYKLEYVDGSHTTGDLSLDTVALDSVSFPNIIFGCGHDNSGIFSGVESGIIGMNYGPLSLISQIGNSVGGKQFSYCLVPVPSFTSIAVPSKMNLGRLESLSGPEVVTTPFLPKDNDKYFLELQGISVAANNIPVVPGDGDPAKGNIVMDSGTTFTALPQELYGKFETAIRQALYDLVVKSDPFGTFGLCFSTKVDIQGPVVTVHFNGADVKLKPNNLYIRVDSETTCLAFFPSKVEGIYGNWQQTNFMIGYDLDKKIVSFKPTDCTS